MDKASLARRLLHVAWMSILLGIVIQLLVMAAVRAWPTGFLAELTGKITWSLAVCSAVALATAASKASSPVAGLAGLLAAPAAISVARTAQKAVAGAMGTPVDPPLFVVLPVGAENAVVKAVQYALFGWFIARAVKGGSLKGHLLVGLTLGGAVTGYVVLRTIGVHGAATADHFTPLLARCVNEMAFPMGCAVVVWGSGVLAGAK